MSRQATRKLFISLGLAILATRAWGQPSLDARRAWIEPVGANVDANVWIQVDCGQPQLPASPLSFTVEYWSRQPVKSASLVFEVRDPSGAVVFSQEYPVTPGPETNTLPIAWDASAAPAGEYRVDLRMQRPPSMEMASREFVIINTCWHTVLAEYARVRAALESLESVNSPSPYVQLRRLLAGRVVHRAEAAKESEDWVVFYRLVKYLCATNESIRGMLTFADTIPELATPFAMPPAERLRLANGLFLAGDQPVYLFGNNAGTGYGDVDLGLWRDLGMTLTVVSVGPAQSMPSPDQAPTIPDALGALFAQAQEAGAYVMASLAPQDMPAWAIDRWPFLVDAATNALDLSKPEARNLIDAHVRALAPWLATQQRLAGIDILHETQASSTEAGNLRARGPLVLMNEPRFRFTGEDVRQRFLARVNEIYADRHAVNQSWRGLFADLNEIAIGWDNVNPRYQKTAAYQYDWQTFHQTLTTEYVEQLAALVRHSAGGVPLGAVMGGILKQDESKFGLERDRLLDVLDVNGLSTQRAPQNILYAMDYPEPYVEYSLLRSLAPDKPLINYQNALYETNNCDSSWSSAYVRATMWQSAMAGLAASALAVPDPLAEPACLEGYAMANLDLNRLASVVAAFQNATPHAHILWSESSKIFSGGVPYLQSVKNAYEGCSFGGYKTAFITEDEVIQSNLEYVTVLVLPETPSVRDKTFEAMKQYVARGGILVRPATPILYDERGQSRRDVISNSRNTVLVHGEFGYMQYLHAMDAVTGFHVLPEIARTITEYGYPLEGVLSRFVTIDGQGYLYMLNIRRVAANVSLAGPYVSGRDLIQGEAVRFPLSLEPLRPMLVRLDTPAAAEAPVAVQPGRPIPCP